MSTTRYQALGPLQAGEGSRAFLGLEISEDNRATPVVIIWVPDEAEKDLDLLAKIRRETEHAAKLDHPNIVRVAGFAKLDEGHARVVEFADGESLRKILEAGKTLPPRMAARVICDACTGTHYAHVAGNDDDSPLVHGDLRPETILVSFGGVTKVTGYGALAFAPRELGGLRVKGRRVHSAPEQIIGGREAITIATDVYLLGLTMYEVLCGEVPWHDQADFFDQAVLTLPLPPAPPGKIPEAVEKVIQKACSKKASDRYPTPLAMREALEEAVAGDIATVEELSSHLEGLFPESHRVRAARRHTIDAGIADFARRQWAEQEKARAGGAGTPTPLAVPITRAPTPMQTPAAAAPAAGPAAPAAPAAPPRTQTPPPRPHYEAPAPLEPEEEPKESSATPWVVFAAVLVAAAGVWWGVTKANTPIPTVEEKPVVPKKKVDLPVDVSAIEAAALDAGAQESAAEAPRDAGRAEPDAGAPKAAAAVPDAGLAEVEADIDSQPTAELTIDGKITAHTPWKGTLPAGPHTLTFVNKPMLLSTGRAITLKAGEPYKEKFVFERGKVTVVAPPGAVIFIDGTRVGVAPMKDDIVAFQGGHRILVTVGAAKWQQSFVLGAERVTFNVEPE